MADTVKFSSSRLEATMSGFSAIAQMHADLAKCGPSKISVDFGSVHWADAQLASAMRVVVDHAFRRGQSLTFTNIRQDVNTILRKNGFFTNRLQDTYSTTIPCTLFGPEGGVEFAEFARKYLSHSSMPRMTKSLGRKFFEGIDEIFANSSLHSETPTPIAVCGQFFPRKEKLTFVISDGGRGMRGSYVSWSGSDISASRAIAWAMEDHSTSRVGDIPGGLGLALIREFVSLNGGQLVVASDAGFWCQNGPSVTMTDMKLAYPGTSVVLEIDCADAKQYDVHQAIDPENIW